MAEEAQSLAVNFASLRITPDYLHHVTSFGLAPTVSRAPTGIGMSARRLAAANHVDWSDAAYSRGDVSAIRRLAIGNGRVGLSILRGDR